MGSGDRKESEPSSKRRKVDQDSTQEEENSEEVELACCGAIWNESSEEPVIQCEECKQWFHFTCQKVSKAPAAWDSWFCRTCRDQRKQDRKSKQVAKKLAAVNADEDEVSLDDESYHEGGDEEQPHSSDSSFSDDSPSVPERVGGRRASHGKIPVPEWLEGPDRAEREQFWKALQSFLKETDQPIYKIPLIDRKQLDLYVCYHEVVKRGGFDKVIAER